MSIEPQQNVLMTRPRGGVVKDLLAGPIRKELFFAASLIDIASSKFGIPLPFLHEGESGTVHAKWMKWFYHICQAMRKPSKA